MLIGATQAKHVPNFLQEFMVCVGSFTCFALVVFLASPFSLPLHQQQRVDPAAALE